MSFLQKKRLEYQPAVADLLKDLNQVQLKPTAAGKNGSDVLQKFFPNTRGSSPYLLEKGEAKRGPLKVGVIFSGGQASGGHNVLAGIFHGLKTFDPQSTLFGFLGGPSGIIENQRKELKEKDIASHFNQGGFDLIGTGRAKIETEEQMAKAMASCKDLDGLIIIGGDDSNTNAALLAEYFLQQGCQTRVIGVPKTIDGDLRSQDIELSFGFDSACKTYSEIIGNIARDALSAKKYYHFIKLMGRSASHITLECALATHPNLALIGEERKPLSDIVSEISTLIAKRHEKGKDYGVILIPEGLIEFIPGEIKFDEAIQKQMDLERDPHGNIQLSKIDTQVFLMNLVKKECPVKFSAQDHFLGYEGRSCFPSNFDANYAYSLGLLASVAVRDGVTGAISAIQNLKQDPKHWKCKMVPIVQLIHLEKRQGKEKPVIQKALVDLKSPPYQQFAKMRQAWEMEDDYQYPGPIQFFGDKELTDSVPLTL